MSCLVYDFDFVVFKAGEKKWGTDESRFNVVLATRNFKQLNATFNEYVKVRETGKQRRPILQIQNYICVLYKGGRKLWKF